MVLDDGLITIGHPFQPRTVLEPTQGEAALAEGSAEGAFVDAEPG